MSFRLIVICENHLLDPPMIEPILHKMLDSAGRGKCRIEANTIVPFHGVDQALNADTIQEIIESYKQADLFLLCIDRDGMPGRRKSLDRIEQVVKPTLRNHQTLIGEHAIEEIEAWILAGMLDIDTPWTVIRANLHAKEILAAHAKRRGLDAVLPVEVRRRLGREAAQNYPRIRQLCEEVQRLEDRIRDWLATRH